MLEFETAKLKILKKEREAALKMREVGPSSKE